MQRRELTDTRWDLIRNLLPEKSDDPGRPAKSNRRFVNAVLWIARTGAPWRDLPERFGKRNSTLQRFRQWCVKGVWQQVAEVLGIDEDLKVIMLDNTIVRTHQHTAVAKQTIARSLTRRIDNQDSHCC